MAPFSFFLSSFLVSLHSTRTFTLPVTLLRAKIPNLSRSFHLLSPLALSRRPTTKCLIADRSGTLRPPELERPHFHFRSPQFHEPFGSSIFSFRLVLSHLFGKFPPPTFSWLFRLFMMTPFLTPQVTLSAVMLFLYRPSLRFIYPRDTTFVHHFTSLLTACFLHLYRNGS